MRLVFFVLVIVLSATSLMAQKDNKREEWLKNEKEKRRKYKQERDSLLTQYIKAEKELLKEFKELKFSMNIDADKLAQVETDYPKDKNVITLFQMEEEINKLEEEIPIKANDNSNQVLYELKLPLTNTKELESELSVNRPIYSPLPQNSFKVSSSFSKNRFHPILNIWRPHFGIDLSAPKGTKVFSTGNGIVILSRYSESAGQYITVDHGNTYTTTYMHLDEMFVKKGDKVKRGQIIGTVGTTGISTGFHLHYEIRKNGNALNPAEFILKHF